MTPAEFDAAIEDLADERRLPAFHWPDSRRVTRKGWPDWVLLGRHGILFREAKTGRAKPTPEQTATGYALMALGLSWRVWRPADLDSGDIAAEMDAIR